MGATWSPGCDTAMLKARADLYRIIREYMRELGVLEVETPVLNRHANTEPQITPLTTLASGADSRYYLHTSPEFYMKRLLAAGSGAIYQLCKVFRDAEQSRRHQVEFTMLEWYRPGLDHHALMEEITMLLNKLALPAANKATYAERFVEHTGLHPHQCSDTDLQEQCRQHGFDCPQPARELMLDFLFSKQVSPHLGLRQPEFIYDYPACQAALARIRTDPLPVAERFELFINGMELANGFNELSDPDEQRQRFEKENSIRQQRGLPLLPIDEPFLQALKHGLPDCAGVALGVDRLLMILTQSRDIEQVVSFRAGQ
ncbi:MAG: EF-P lysine aminoacylase EpmA [Gammaproteobacteria bacterium]